MRNHIWDRLIRRPGWHAMSVPFIVYFFNQSYRTLHPREAGELTQCNVRELPRWHPAHWQLEFHQLVAPLNEGQGAGFWGAGVLCDHYSEGFGFVPHLQ